MNNLINQKLFYKIIDHLFTFITPDVSVRKLKSPNKKYGTFGY